MPDFVKSVLGRSLARYTMAVVLVTVGFLLRFVMERALGQQLATFITFYPIVMLVAILGGLSPGLLATALFVLGTDYFILPPHGHFAIASLSDLVSLVFFAAMGVFISLLAEHHQRSQRQEQISEMQKRQAEMMRLSFDAIVVLRPGGAVESWNRGAEQVYGYSESEVIGSDPHRLLRTSPDVPWPEVVEILRKQGSWERELRQVAKDGRQLIVSARYQLIEGPDGTERILKISRDITERKQAEKTLARHQEKLAAALANMKDAVFISDTSGNFINFNDSFATFHRFRNKAECPRSLNEMQDAFELFTVDGEVAPLENRPVSRALRGEMATEVEFSLRRKDTGESWIASYSFSPICETHGAISGAVVVARDITERKQAEKHIRQLNRVYAVLSDINQTIVREKDSETMLQAACRIAVEKGMFRMAWIGMINPATQVLEPIASSGVVDGYIEKIKIDFSGPEYTTGPGALFLETGKHAICNDIEHELHQPWTQEALKRGYRSSAALLLRCEGRVIGVFGLYASELAYFDDDEIKLLDEMAMDISFALEVNRHEEDRQRAEKHVRQLNRVYAVLSDINQTIVREKDSNVMLEAACRIAVEKGDFKMAWIGMVNHATNILEPMVFAGESDGYLDQVKIDLQDTATGPAASCFHFGRHSICNDIEHDPHYAPWREEALRRGYRSSAGFPLKVDGKVVGVFSLYAGELSFFDEEEIKLLDEMAMDISFALEVNRGEVEKRKAEDELHWRTAFFEAQVDSALDGVLVVDSKGKKILQNQKLNGLLKIPKEIAENPDDSLQLQFVTGMMKNPGQFAEKVHYLIAHPEEVSRDELELTDGTTLERYSAPVRDKAQNHYGRIWTFRNITERRQLEEQFRQAQKMEAVGQLTGGIAHDFNNLLTVILGCSEVIGEEVRQNPKLSKMAGMVVDAARRGAELTHRMLAFARRQNLQSRTIDINRLLVDMDDFLRRTLSAEIELDIIQGPDDCKATADLTQLESALLNLCVNARDAMPNGGRLTIEARNTELDSGYAEQNPDVTPGQYVQIAVTDTGCGISPENMARVFDPFFTTKEVGKGTGLGLSMVYGFAKQSQGHVKIYSETGHGTTVKLYLPKASSQSEPPSKFPVAIDDLRGSEVVLLVEDNEPARENAKCQLADLGYQVLQAADGVEALKIVAERPDIDLLFTDMVMPGGLNGHELALAALHLNPKLKVLYCSGYAENAILRQGLLDKDVQLLNKPYTRLELARRIKRVLTER